NENANAGWQAYLNGERLTPVRLDGWRQAWELPAGGGEVVLRYEPDAPYRAAFAGGAAAALLVLALALIPARRRPSPGAVGPGRASTVLMWAAAVAAGPWSAWPAGAAVAVALRPPVRCQRRRPAPRPASA